MRREYYPLEMRTIEPRRSLLSNLLHTNFKIKINTIIALIASVIFIALIVSIPTVPGESYYYENYTFVVGYRDVGIYPIQEWMKIYKHLLDFKPIFHVYYWIAIIGYIVAGSGMIFNNIEEVKRGIKIYYIISTATIITGAIKIIILLNFQLLGSFVSNIVLTLFLAILPLIIVLPIQLLLVKSEKSSIEWINEHKEEGKMGKIGARVVIASMFIVAILVGLSYLGLEILI